VCAVEVDGVEAISVRSMCYLTLTIDHRALDAFQANAFLSSVSRRSSGGPRTSRESPSRRTRRCNSPITGFLCVSMDHPCPRDVRCVTYL